MTSAPGDRFEISIGGDASGPVVAGRDNRVETTAPPADVRTGSGPAEGDAPGDSTQNNTAKDHGRVFTVMNGELHIHQEGGNSGKPQEG